MRPAPIVLHVFKDAYPPTYGGVEQHIWDVTRSLRKEFDFTVLTSARSRRRSVEDLEGVRVVRAPEYGRAFSTPITPSWWWELARSERTVTHLHLPSPLGELAVLTSPQRPPLVASFYADVVRNPAASRGYAVLQQRVLSRAERIVVSSPMVAESSPALARHQERVAVIPFGVDPGDWPVDRHQVAAIARAHPGPLVLFLGRLVHYKGVEVLIEAMRSIDATLLVVGDGPRRPALEAAAASVGVRGASVRFLGNVTNEERTAYYEAAAVFVLPAVSRAETFGIAMLEAMATGTPAISTEVGTGTSWVNRSGETGLVVPPRDPGALAEAITTLLADDRLRRDYGEAAARRAREHFAKSTMLERLSALYREASVSRPRPARAGHTTRGGR